MRDDARRVRSEHPEPAARSHRWGDLPADVPPGWQYNPAAWSQRLPIVGLALVGAAMSGYLALYQYGAVTRVWEPFFGNGSERILKSPLSFALPIPDAALGALAYLADAITGVVGSPSRWRTQPWIVVVFGVLVGPLGAISVGLVIAQPVIYDAWCTLCLVSAAVSIAMIGPAMDEVLASVQHLNRIARRGESVWQAFWGRHSP